MFRRFFKFCLYFILVLGLITAAVGCFTVAYFYIRFTRDLPRIERINDYRPKAVSSIYAADGTLIAEQYEERRYPVAFSEVPQMVKNAFIAAEDAEFYSHKGIDLKGIVRALIVNFRSKDTKQGASTITQQIVKSLLLSREKTYERKAKEAILAYRLENALTKDEIFSIYLNEIYLGSRAYGVKAAARVHFHKELNELSLAEIAFLAGLPQKPSDLTKPSNREAAKMRQQYVLRQMLKNGLISEAQAEAAKKEEIVVYPPHEQTVFAVPYFSGFVIKELEAIFRRIDKYYTATAPGGFRIHTTADLRAHKFAEAAVKKGLQDLDKRQGWRGPVKELLPDEQEVFLKKEDESIESLQPGTIYSALVVEKMGRSGSTFKIKVGGEDGCVDLSEAKWAWRFLESNDVSKAQTIDPALRFKPGAVIEVSLREESGEKAAAKADSCRFVLNQTPQVEGVFVCAHALTGEIVVIIGGYDYGRSQFNRATSGRLQPGSAFKPLVYLTAVETLGYTPATIVSDSPVSMVAGNGKIWSPKNYDRKYLGPMTLRRALEKSRNVVSVHLIRRVGVDRVINTAKRLGISTPIARNLSISLGTPEVIPLELIRAYGAFAAGGWLAEPLFVTKIEDRDGNIIYQQRPKQRRVIDEDTAFIMASMMKGVVERGTAQLVSKLGKPVAGKTGTTNEQMDAWFIGYTPEWVAGAWVGFDVKRTLGRFETGGKAAAPIFLDFMEEFLKDTPPLDFDIPDGVIPVSVDLQTGHLVEPGAAGSIIEYFKSGTEPTYSRQEIELPKDYLESDDF